METPPADLRRSGVCNASPINDKRRARRSERAKSHKACQQPSFSKVVEKKRKYDKLGVVLNDLGLW